MTNQAHVPGRDGHLWNNTGYASYWCDRCGLGDYEAEGTGPCRGRPSFACPQQSNGFTHGSCLLLFDTRNEATTHYRAVHQTPAQRAAYETYCVRHAARQAQLAREGR